MFHLSSAIPILPIQSSPHSVQIRSQHYSPHPVRMPNLSGMSFQTEAVIHAVAVPANAQGHYGCHPSGGSVGNADYSTHTASLPPDRLRHHGLHPSGENLEHDSMYTSAVHSNSHVASNRDSADFSIRKISTVSCPESNTPPSLPPNRNGYRRSCKKAHKISTTSCPESAGLSDSSCDSPALYYKHKHSIRHIPRPGNGENG